MTFGKRSTHDASRLFTFLLSLVSSNNVHFICKVPAILLAVTLYILLLSISPLPFGPFSSVRAQFYFM